MKWLQYAIIILFIGGMAFLGLQQQYRHGANDPQVQIVDDVARAVEGGVNPAQIIPNPSTDIAVSLSPFLAAFSADRVMTLSSGVVDGSAPTISPDIFAAAKAKGEYRTTWEPKEGVRVALVLRALKDGTYIASGRNLREVDARISQLHALAWMGIGLALLLTLLFEMFGAWRHAHSRPPVPPPTSAQLQH
ncbi:MAG: hypothetical protein KBE09_04470 [Candidatus Pacebacteria bacterium]|nr:hypothetical protein [Candidatus Paceibacterota bacterium]